MAHPIENLSDLNAHKNLINQAIHLLGAGNVGIIAVRDSSSYEEFCDLIANKNKRLSGKQFYALKKYLLKIDYRKIKATYSDPNDEEWVHQYKIPMEEEYREVERNELSAVVPEFEDFENELAFESDKLLAKELDEETEELIKSTMKRLDREYFYERKEVDVTPNLDDLSENTIDELKGEVEDEDM